MEINQKAPITINVELDENKIPKKISWSAPDGGLEDQNAKAMLLSFWNYEKKESFRMDLWVKDMPIEDMKQFFYQNLVSMTKTYYKATQDEKMTATMNDFCDYFSEKLNLK